jgi:hypothetical protein
MVTTFAADTIVRVRPATKTVRGSVIPDWEHATALSIGGCSFQPAATSLSQDGRVLGVSDGATCYCPYGADVQEGDRIDFGGQSYAINGAPRPWRSPTGNRSNIMLNLVRWSG